MDDEDRNGRVKVIPAVAEGPWIVKKVELAVSTMVRVNLTDVIRRLGRLQRLSVGSSQRPILLATTTLKSQWMFFQVLLHGI